MTLPSIPKNPKEKENCGGLKKSKCDGSLDMAVSRWYDVYFIKKQRFSEKDMLGEKTKKPT
jgi:hypothetical protein